MLFRARQQYKIGELVDDEDELDLFKTTPAHIERHGEGTFFTLKEDEYEGDWLFQANS